MARTPGEIAQHHFQALAAGDAEMLFADYNDQSVIVTPQGAFRGNRGIRQFWGGLFEELPNPKLEVISQTLEGQTLLLLWAAETDNGRVDGVDTFVFDEDGIRIQTVHHIKAA